MGGGARVGEIPRTRSAQGGLAVQKFCNKFHLLKSTFHNVISIFIKCTL